MTTFEQPTPEDFSKLYHRALQAEAQLREARAEQTDAQTGHGEALVELAQVRRDRDEHVRACFNQQVTIGSLRAEVASLTAIRERAVAVIGTGQRLVFARSWGEVARFILGDAAEFAGAGASARSGDESPAGSTDTSPQPSAAPSPEPRCEFCTDLVADHTPDELASCDADLRAPNPSPEPPPEEQT